MSARSERGSRVIIRLIVVKFFEPPPSTRYEARVHGAPENPRRAAESAT